MSGGLERFLLRAGETVIRVPPKLMANARRGARTFAKSDSIDALASRRRAARARAAACAPLTRLATRGRAAGIGYRATWSTSPQTPGS